MVTTFTRTVNMHFTRLAILFAVLFSTLAATATAPQPAAAAGCYETGSTIYRSVTAGYWTGWYYRTATSSCADLNVAITNYPSYCRMWVDAQYYSRSQGRWIDGAADDFWMYPGIWRQPLTNMADGTYMRVDFYPECSDSSVRLRLAY